MTSPSEMNNRSNLPRSAMRAISWMTDSSLLLAAAPSYLQPEEWLPVPRTKTPRCIWRLAAHIRLALPVLGSAHAALAPSNANANTRHAAADSPAGLAEHDRRRSTFRRAPSRE